MPLQYPWDIVKKAWGLGLMNGGIPQEYGESDVPLCVCCSLYTCTYMYVVNMYIIYTCMYTYMF